MRTKRLYFILVGLLLAGGLVALFNRQGAREPVYGGKRLSGWVEMTYWDGAIVDSTSMVIPHKARNAIRQAGTNALPYLLQWLRYEPPAWKSNSIALLNKVFHSSLVDRRARRADGAVRAIAVLGREAEGVVPELALLMNDRRAPASAGRASFALELISWKVLSANMALMTNNSAVARYDAAAWFASRIPVYSPAVPGLIQLLQDQDAAVVSAAASALGFAELSAKQAVPALEKSLHDQRFSVRRVAILALGRFEDEARSAVPALVALRQNDPDFQIRKLAAEALDKIDPIALRKAEKAKK